MREFTFEFFYSSISNLPLSPEGLTYKIDPKSVSLSPSSLDHLSRNLTVPSDQQKPPDWFPLLWPGSPSWSILCTEGKEIFQKLYAICYLLLPKTLLWLLDALKVKAEVLTDLEPALDQTRPSFPLLTTSRPYHPSLCSWKLSCLVHP